MTAQVLVLAKAPRPGHVKTRLCPPCTPHQAAAVAVAALHDTLDAVDEAPAELVGRRILVLAEVPEDSIVDSDWWPRTGWELCWQRGTSLGERIGHAFSDTAVSGLPSVLIGMDTPQVTGALLARCLDQLWGADAVLGPAADGGWWLLGLRDPAAAAAVLAPVPTSRPDTGARTLAALSRSGLSVATAPVLRDVDTATDARQVAALCRADSRFATSVSRNVPSRGSALLAVRAHG
jgi:rSAM/selenodomain-associated transferase 1